MELGRFALLAQNQGGGGAAAVILIIELAVLIVALAGMWKMYVKAGKPGWAALIPIYNVIVLLEIVGRPIWWLILLIVPLVNIIIVIVLTFDLARKFGKGGGFALGLLFLGFIFYPILGFGDARYNPNA